MVLLAILTILVTLCKLIIMQTLSLQSGNEIFYEGNQCLVLLISNVVKLQC